MVAHTSSLAFASIQKRLGAKQQQVYRVIEKHQPITNEGIAEILGLPINQVTGRVTELTQFGIVGFEGLGVNKTGHKAKLWSTRDPNDKKAEALANDCEG